MGLYQKTLGIEGLIDILIRLEVLEKQYAKVYGPNATMQATVEPGKKPNITSVQEGQRTDITKHPFVITYKLNSSEYELQMAELAQTEQTGWTITGKNADGQEVEAHYSTYEEMKELETQILRQIGGYAVIHQHGTTICKIIEVGPPL